MKLELEFDENDTVESVVEAAKKQIERMKKHYEDSVKRHQWLVKNMFNREDGSYNHRYNTEAEEIEEMWIRMGVRF